MFERTAFGIVGCGRMGARRARTVRECADARLARVYDVEEPKAESLAAEHDVPRAETYEGLLDAVEWVVLSVPNAFHATMAVQAAEAGVEVFCEKPLAATPEGAREMVTACIDNDVRMKVGSNLRYFRSVQKARSLVADGAVGDPLFFRGWIGNDGGHLENSWFADPELAGGGTFLDNGCHMLDLSRWFLGEVESGTGLTSSVYHDIGTEDNGVGVFRFEGGELATIQSSWTEWDGYAYFELSGTEGLVRVDVRHPSARVEVRRPDGYTESYDYAGMEPNSYEAELATLVDAVHTDERPEPDAFDAMRAVEMAHAVYDAEESGAERDLWTDDHRALRERFLGRGVLQ